MSSNTPDDGPETPAPPTATTAATTTTTPDAGSAPPTPPARPPTATRKVVRLLVNTLIAALVIFGGVRLASWFRASSVEPPREKPEDKGVLVETREVAAGTHAVDITGFGNVIPARTATLRPQVQGKVTWIDDDLVLGGQLASGEEIVKIDARDYRLAIDELQTTVEQARAQLELERGREEVAEREWALLEDQVESSLGDLGAEFEGLATREPQIRSARAQVEAARSRLARARLDLSRTTLEAPFNALVQQEAVEVGDLVTQQSTVATLVGTDQFWVQVAVPLESLTRIDVPGIDATEGEGSVATITLEADGVVVTREGEVLRLLGELDPQGRMARLLVSVERPLAVEPGGLPILLGAYVAVRIHTEQPVRGIEVPRAALHEGNLVYVYADGALEIREVVPVWRTEDTVIIGSGLQAGELIVTSPIAAPMEGMKLRTRDPAPPLAAPKPRRPGEPDTAAAEPTNGAGTKPTDGSGDSVGATPGSDAAVKPSRLPQEVLEK